MFRMYKALLRHRLLLKSKSTKTKTTNKLVNVNTHKRKFSLHHFSPQCSYSRKFLTPILRRQQTTTHASAKLRLLQPIQRLTFSTNNNHNNNNTILGNDSFLSGNMSEYCDTLYEDWLNNPSSVDPSWAEYFAKLHSNIVNHAAQSPSSSPSLSPTHSPPPRASHALPQSGGDRSTAQMITDATNLLKFVHSYQAFGHFVAKLDPLKIMDQGVDRKQFVPELLKKERWGFTDADLDREIYVGEHSQFLALMGVNSPYVTLRNVEQRLQEVYCANIGYQYMHIANFEKNNFMRKKIENKGRGHRSLLLAGAEHAHEQKIDETLDVSVKTAEEKLRILDRLMWAEEFENFLDVKYPAQKRFGINGAESFVPLLKEIIDEGARLGIKDFVIGMPHRGRLLFLATVLRKPLEHIFYEFRGLAVPMFSSGDSGDVKYHLGCSVDRYTPDELYVHLSLLPNPSHLEAIDPVIMGKTRAKQHFNDDTTRKQTCAIVIHGDASFAGQGVVYESMALTDLPKYTTGGVIHIIVNNQIGFTTDAYDSRSSPYCTDVARSVAAPIMHVNGDNPESCVESARLAMQFRQEFSCDAVIDMLCFRRYGHNEGDEPMFTQPLMYSVIHDKVKNNDVVIANYQQKLLDAHIINEAEISAMRQRIRNILIASYDKSAHINAADLEADWLGNNWANIKGRESLKQNIGIERTGVSAARLQYIGDVMTTFPADFKLHRNLQKIMQKRRDSVLGGAGGGADSRTNKTAPKIDWGTAEHLAYGSLLMEGIHVRVSGQDCERGTFSHRHAVVHDQNREERKRFVPLRELVDPVTEVAVGARFAISNSNLSEFGVLGFEYGYSCESPQSLVVWEAQFGDFANGAQVIFDQFISSGEVKWLRQSGLVLLLPHGYEGGGPEHSSAKPERYLLMCNDDEDVYDGDYAHQILDVNWQVVNCTTPANFFHVIRRQTVREFRKPLIVFTPKYGLRHALAVSELQDFVDEGGVDGDGVGSHFRRIIVDDERVQDAKKVRKIVFCSGKIWINLTEHKLKTAEETEEKSEEDVLLIRIEQICPFPYDLITRELEKYASAREIVWCQEEPKNMGSYHFVEKRLHTTLKHMGDARRVSYIGRSANASPATGYPQVHARETNEILNAAFA